MFLYQSTRRFFAVAADATEELVARELCSLGATETSTTRRGVHFRAEPEALCRIVYAARLCGRVLAPLESFACHSDRYLRRRVEEIEWETLLGPDDTLSISATVANSRLRHSQYAALVTKDAICDRFREREGRRPSVDRRSPDLRLHLHVQGNKATLSVDCGDGARHRRGYRSAAGDAPLPETAAAAVIALTGWEGERPLFDPMCGAGTLLAEAALVAGRVPAGFGFARFGLERLPAADREPFARVRAQIDAGRRPLAAGILVGNESDAEVLAVARGNLGRVPGGEAVQLHRGDFRDHPGLRDGVIVCNPPWGVRLGRPEEARANLRELGDFLKRRCAGSTAWILVGDRELAKHVGLRASRRIPLNVGGRDARLLRFDLY